MFNKKISMPTATPSVSLKTLAVPGLVLVLIIASALAIVLPRFREIGPLRTEIQKKEKKLAQLTVKSNYLNGLNQYELTARANHLLQVLPEEKKVPYLFVFFKLMARKNNLTVISVSVSPGILGEADKSKGQTLPLLDFGQSLTGNLNDIKTYLSDLNRAAPLMVVDSLSLSGSKEEGEKMELTLTVRTPYLYLPEEIGSVETPLAEITSEDDLVYRRVSQLKAESEVEADVGRSVPSGKQNPFGY